jgi:hypothetical protein
MSSELERRLREEPDFINYPAASNSLASVMAKKDVVPTRTAARMLLISEQEYLALRDRLLAQLKVTLSDL